MSPNLAFAEVLILITGSKRVISPLYLICLFKFCYLWKKAVLTIYLHNELATLHFFRANLACIMLRDICMTVVFLNILSLFSIIKLFDTLYRRFCLLTYLRVIFIFFFISLNYRLFSFLRYQILDWFLCWNALD